MKRIIAAGFILLMAGLVCAPSYAMETKVMGDLTINGILNVADDDGEEETMAFREMAVELNTVTQINEKIKLVTQTEILDKVLNGKDSNVGDGDGNENDNIQIERFYMDIVTSFGLLSLGRMEISTWGTSFYDDGDSGDRIKLVTPLTLGNGKLYIGLVAEKAHEGETDAAWTSNRDNDKYYATSTYATQTYRTGILFGYYPYSGSFIDPALGMNADFLYIAPYFSGKVGPLMINAEYGQITGEYQMNHDNPLKPLYDGASASTKGDIDTSCYWLEVGYPAGKANIELGYYYMSGDKTSVAAAAVNYAAVGADFVANGAGSAAVVAATGPQFDDIESAAFIAPGSDWEKVFILTADDHGIGGNILEAGSDMNIGGMSLFYLSCDFDVSDSVNVYGLYAMATADATATGVDDDYGMEIDLGFNWKIMDNLEYNGRAGYLMGGDWWEDTGNATKDLSIIALYHEVVLSF